jgi:hypothetical protein
MTRTRRSQARAADPVDKHTDLGASETRGRLSVEELEAFQVVLGLGPPGTLNENLGERGLGCLTLGNLAPAPRTIR